jgi:putative transcriptional regulator
MDPLERMPLLHKQEVRGSSPCGPTIPLGELQCLRVGNTFHIQEKDDAMKKKNMIKVRKESAGSRIIASLQEAVDRVEGKDIAVRVSTVEVPTVDVRETRRYLGLSQAAFAAKFGFQPATLRNREQGRTRPDDPARVLLAVIARHPEAVEDALRKAR